MQVSAVILTGGRSRRFGGTHKPGVDLDGRAVISRILAAVLEAEPSVGIWIAGPLEGLSEVERSSVDAVREEPNFSGPLAGIAAAVNALVSAQGGADIDTGSGDGSEGDAGSAGGDVTLLIAGDMPLVTPAHLRDLITACRDAGAPAVGFDDRGSMQFLCAAWPTRLLLARLEEIGDPADKAVKLLYRDLETVRVDVDPCQLLDFDTPEEFDRVRTRLKDTPEPKTRSVPEAVLRLREQAAQSSDAPVEWSGISAADAEAVLDFASRIKHSDAELSPVLAAFLAGTAYARQEEGETVAKALARVERVLRSAD